MRQQTDSYGDITFDIGDSMRITVSRERRGLVTVVLADGTPIMLNEHRGNVTQVKKALEAALALIEVYGGV